MTPAAPAGLSTLSEPPHEPGPAPQHTALGSGPTGPPPREPVSNLHPIGPSRSHAPGKRLPKPGGPDPRPRATRQRRARNGGGRETAAARAAQGGAGRAGAPQAPRDTHRHGRSGGTPRACARARTPHARGARAPAPDTGQAWRDPPPTQRGEAQAAVGEERRSAPPRGRQTSSHAGEKAPPNTHKGMQSPHTRVATTRTGGAATGGFRYPKAPSRIAREGFLTKGASPPTQIRPPIGTRQTKGVSSRGRQDPGRGRKVHGNGLTQGIPEHSRSGPTPTRAACLPHARGCLCHRPEGAPRLQGRPKKNRGETPAATRWARNRQVLAQRGFWPSATAPARPATITQLAPPSQSPTPSGQQRPLRGGDDKAPAPHSRGNGCASLHRFCHPPTSGISANGGDPKGGTLGTGNGATTRLQAPETTWSAPGAPRRARRHTLSTPRR